MTDHTPVTLCWHCDRPLDAATSIDDKGQEQHPSPGAVSLCLYCGAVAFFEADLRLRAPTEEELNELSKDEAFRHQYVNFSWARQYVMRKESLLRDRDDPDR